MSACTIDEFCLYSKYKKAIGSLSNNDGNGYEKRHLKSEFAPLRTLLRFFHLV